MKGNFNASLEVKGSVSAGGGGSAGGKASAREDADFVTE
jgi:hypothetical protein